MRAASLFEDAEGEIRPVVEMGFLSRLSGFGPVLQRSRARCLHRQGGGALLRNVLCASSSLGPDHTDSKPAKVNGVFAGKLIFPGTASRENVDSVHYRRIVDPAKLPSPIQLAL